MLSFRRALISDSVRLTDIAMASKRHWGYSDEFMASCRDELNQSPQKIQSPEFLFRVAEDREQVVGFFCLEVLSDAEAEVEALFIAPDFIGRGYGRQCWETLIAVAHEIHLEKISIASDPHALSFYLKMGAEEVGKIASESINGRYLPLLEYTISV